MKEGEMAAMPWPQAKGKLLAAWRLAGAQPPAVRRSAPVTRGRCAAKLPSPAQ